MQKIVMISAIVALVILSFTFAFAYFLSEYRLSYVETKLNDSTYELFDLIVGIDIINSSKDCNIIGENIKIYNDKVYDLGKYLTKVEQGNEKSSLYNNLKVRYNYLNILLYYKYSEYYNICNLNKNELILYFYGKDDYESVYQGEVLDNLVKTDSNLKVFAVASYIPSLPVDIVLNRTDKSKMPVIYINDNFYSGFKDAEELKNIIYDINGD